MHLPRYVLIDTSLLIDRLRLDGGVYISVIEQAKTTRVVPAICDLVMYELWSGRSMEKASEAAKAEQILHDLPVLPLTTTAAQLAGDWRRQGITEGLDALIAAIAVEHRAHLATLNAKRFEHVPGLNLWKS